jgi:hypothetical protein
MCMMQPAPAWCNEDYGTETNDPYNNDPFGMSDPYSSPTGTTGSTGENDPPMTNPPMNPPMMKNNPPTTVYRELGTESDESKNIDKTKNDKSKNNTTQKRRSNSNRRLGSWNSKRRPKDIYRRILYEEKWTFNEKLWQFEDSNGMAVDFAAKFPHHRLLQRGQKIRQDARTRRLEVSLWMWILPIRQIELFLMDVYHVVKDGWNQMHF